MKENNLERRSKEAYNGSEFIDVFYELMGFIFSMKAWLVKSTNSFLKKLRTK